MHYESQLVTQAIKDASQCYMTQKVLAKSTDYSTVLGANNKDSINLLTQVDRRLALKQYVFFLIK